MDGTLWDSAAEVAESWNETVKRAGYDRKPITVKDIQSVMGKTMDVIARILFPDLEEDERQKLLAQCGEEENEYLRIHGATLYPDIRRTMEQLKKKYHLYIVSNCQSGYIEAFLDYYKLHDLKTPITAVKGYSEGIMDGVANTPEKLDKYIRTIYNKANEMDTLINELTLYSKIDTNRIPYDFAKLNVAAYFKDCVEEIGLDLEAKGIALSYFNYATPDTQIIADPEQLRRVINNIIGNSVKYMNKTEKFINIRIKDVGDFIQVEIEDDGRGIAQKDLPYIFDRFYRTDASRNSATGGSGIGLSIVKKIIEDHGGKIWATSKEDSGTTMYFVIRKYQEVTANEQNTDR